MAVVNPQHVSAHLVVCIECKVGAVLERYAAFVPDRGPAQGDIAGTISGALVHEIIDPVTLHCPVEIRCHGLDALALELLKADDVGIPGLQIFHHRVPAFLPRGEALILRKGEPSYIVCDNPQIPLILRHCPGCRTVIFPDYENRRENGDEGNDEGSGAAEQGPDKEDEIDRQNRGIEEAEKRHEPGFGRIDIARQIAEQQQSCGYCHQCPRCDSEEDSVFLSFLPHCFPVFPSHRLPASIIEFAAFAPPEYEQPAEEHSSQMCEVGDTVSRARDSREKFNAGENQHEPLGLQ